MFGRIFNGLVVVFWMIAMTWLLAEKVIPPMLGGDPPDYQSVLEPADEEKLPDAWKIRWKDKTVGFAASRVELRPDGELDRLSFSRLRLAECREPRLVPGRRNAL